MENYHKNLSFLRIGQKDRNQNIFIIFMRMTLKTILFINYKMLTTGACEHVTDLISTEPTGELGRTFLGIL